MSRTTRIIRRIWPTSATWSTPSLRPLSRPAREYGRGERGLATLETSLMITILVPLLFAVIEFGDLFQRWLAQESATVQAARYAAELGGDTPEVRALLGEALAAAGIDRARVVVEITPSRVGWRQPLTVSVRSDAVVAIPFALTTTIPLRTTAIVRGELNR